MSAEILKFSDYRINEAADSEIDLATAVDVAIRDLREILSSWGSEPARQRAEELVTAYASPALTPSLKTAIDNVANRVLHT